MRLVLGLLGFHALVLGAGLACLYALGLLEAAWRRALPALGAAHLAGIALTGLPMVFLLVLGAGISGPLFAAVAVLLALALGAFGWWRRRRGFRIPAAEPARSRPLRPGLVTVGLAAAVGLFVAVQAGASADVATAWDAAHIWTFKTVALYHDGALRPSLFANSSLFATSHLDYPLLQPVFGSMAMRFAANDGQGLLAFELWLLVGAMVAAAAFLLGDRSRAWLAVLPLGVLVASFPSGDMVRGDADATMAVFLAIGALAVASWVEEPRPGLLPLAVLLLGAAANVKNEGLAFAGVLLVVGLFSALTLSRRAALAVGAGAVALAALVLPWRLWVHAHGPLPSDVTPASKALHPSFLSDHLGSLRVAAREVVHQLIDQGFWIVPSFLALCALCVWSGSRRRLASFYLIAGVLLLVPVLWVYWISTLPNVNEYIISTSIRTIIGPLFVAAIALAHLLARLGPAESELRPGARPADDS